MAEVFIGLGSNTRPVHHLQLACRALDALLADTAASLVYASPAVGGGPPYLNMVVRGHTSLAPESLVDALKAIEQSAGRQRGRPEVTLDLDLLCFGDLVSPSLRLPRDDVLEHAFVLRPLAELAPERRHPVSGVSFAEHWREAAGHLGDLTPRGTLGTLTPEPGSHGDPR